MERYAREGVPLTLSTIADQVGAGCAVLEPLLRRIEAHVFAAERLALEAVRRIDQLFEIERDINGRSAADRCTIRQNLSAPLIGALEVWMREERAK